MNPLNYVLIGIMISVGIYGYIEHSRFIKIRTEYDSFISETKVLKAQQEAKHAVQISAAMADRDANLVKLRDNQKHTNALQSSLATALSRGTCQDSATDHAALSRFFTEVEGYIIEADLAVINVKAWAASWPTP